MKKFCKLLGIAAIVMVMGFSMIACDDGSVTGDNNDTGININNLPEFPSSSTPAGTKTVAETILAELKLSSVLDSIQEEIEEVVDENRPKRGTFSFSNRSLPNGFVKVSAGATENEINTGGFIPLSDNQKAIHDIEDALYNTDPLDYTEFVRLNDERRHLEEAREGIQFTTGNRENWTYHENQRGELTKAKTEGGATVAQGSIYEMKYTESVNSTVTTAGYFETFRINITYSVKEQTTAALTVTTSSGSVKIILDMTAEWGGTGNNTDFSWENGTWTETEKYSGSLKVYGENNALLIDRQIVDRESLNEALILLK